MNEAELNHAETYAVKIVLTCLLSTLDAAHRARVRAMSTVTANLSSELLQATKMTDDQIEYMRGMVDSMTQELNEPKTPQ